MFALFLILHAFTTLWSVFGITVRLMILVVLLACTVAVHALDGRANPLLYTGAAGKLCVTTRTCVQLKIHA